MKLHKLAKTDLSQFTSIQLLMESSNAVSISHWIDEKSSLSTNYIDNSLTLPFVINAVSSQIPFMDDNEYVMVVREKVNIAESGSKSMETSIISTTDNRVSPYTPKTLPPFFKELKHV